MPNVLRSQRGIGFVGILFIIIFIGLVATIGLRVTPMFLEYQSVLRAITQLKNTPGYPFGGKTEFYRKLEQLLYTNDVKKFDKKMMKDSIKIKFDKKSGEKMLIIDYQREAPFFKNVFFVAKFNKEEPVKPNQVK